MFDRVLNMTFLCPKKHLLHLLRRLCFYTGQLQKGYYAFFMHLRFFSYFLSYSWLKAKTLSNYVMVDTLSMHLPMGNFFRQTPFHGDLRLTGFSLACIFPHKDRIVITLRESPYQRWIQGCCNIQVGLFCDNS